MSYSQNRQLWRSIKLLTVIVLACVGCVGATLLAVNLNPRLLMVALNLRHVGPLESALPLPPEPFRLAGEAQDRVDVVLPPRIANPIALTPLELGGPVTVHTSTPGTTIYLLTIDESGLNDLLRREIIAERGADDRYRHLEIELQPGGLVLYGDVDLGLRWRRMGVLLLQGDDPLTLSTAGIVLDQELYVLSEEGGLSPRLLLPAGRQVQRVLRALTVVGPQLGEARAEAVGFHADRLEILARATYPAPPSLDTGWQQLEPGVELREIDVAPDPMQPPERLRIVRLDPRVVQFRVRYDPGEPKQVSAWAAEEQVLLVVNGGYFTPREEGGMTIGLLVSDGERWGTPLASYAGMFAVTTTDEVSVRWLEQLPYAPEEPLGQALQSFPVLVKPGGEIGFPVGTDEGALARRTVVAQDYVGNVLLMVAPQGYLSLHQLAVFLAESDLMIDVALNLDGGGSTGMWMMSGDTGVQVDSFNLVPSVVTVRRR